MFVNENIVSVSDSQNREHRRALFFRNSCQGDTKKNREHSYLQDLIFSDRFGDVFGKNVKQKIVPVQRGRCRGSFAHRRNHHDSLAGAANVDRDNANQQRDRGHYLKKHQTLDPDPADAAKTSVSCDSRNQRTQNQWRDNHLDQPKKNVAEKAQMFGQVRPVEPDLRSK